MDYLAQYQLWTQKVHDAELAAQLQQMKGDDKAIEDAFYRYLSFGTAGLRGVIGAGTNRMNIYTVSLASQGLANYLTKTFSAPSIAIAYDSRIKSDVFAKTAASVFAANGIKVYIYPELMPVPCLSYAVRYLKTSAGVAVTASHNPSKYNGYKVYGPDGCQTTTDATIAVSAEIQKLDLFTDIRMTDFEEGLKSGKIEYISGEVLTSFLDHVKSQSVLFGDEANKDISIVYSPLNGTGLKPVLRALKESGYSNIRVVKEQEQPDGNFPTCPYPNPEIREALELGIRDAAKYQADLMLATDPDCDRVGIAVKDKNGDYQLLSGNETGTLLLDFVLSQRAKHGKMPAHPVAVKSIVTTDVCERIAKKYGVQCVNVLTGFKYIGEQIGKLEKEGRAQDYVFGFEESYGYLSGSYVRDKDAVDASFLICEMFCYYRTRGISLLDKLEEIYREHGYFVNKSHSYTYEGSSGAEKIQSILAAFRSDMTKIAGHEVARSIDFMDGVDGLPKENVLKYIFADGSSVIVRPSGTEPKLKVYMSIVDANRTLAAEREKKLIAEIEMLLK